MEQLDEIIILLRKHLAGNLSEAEQERLATWAGSQSAYRDLLAKLSAEESLLDGYVDYLQVYDEATSQRLQRIEERLLSDIAARPAEPRQRERHKPWRLRPRVWWAAAALLLVGSVVGWWSISNRQTARSTDMADIQPGGNRATLTLADGRTVDLSSEQEGIIIQDGITYLDGTEVIENGKLKIENEKPTYNAITTPKGGTYQVTLPDGSNVWLNAGSTLKYPGRFSDTARVVFLEGEAFFEVSPAYRTGGHRLSAGRLPFRVITAGQQVDVLGTQFNISAYKDDHAITTTLVTGSVKVLAQDQTAINQRQSRFPTHVLRPGEQSVARGASMEVSQVDIEPYTAWRDGNFVFSGADIRTVMNQLARWYDAEVIYEGLAVEGVFYANISRNKPISEVLNVLEKTKGVQFNIRGRRVMVSR